MSNERLPQISNENLELFFAAVEGLAADPAQLARIRSIGLKHAPTIFVATGESARRAARPMPATQDVTAAQCSIFDNWPDGRRPAKKSKGHYGQRFKMTCDFWTHDVDYQSLRKRNAVFSGMAHLLDREGLISKVSELRKPTKTLRPFIARNGSDHEGIALAAFGDRLVEVAENLPANYRAGPIFTAGEGRYYHCAFALWDGDGMLVIQHDLGEFVFDTFQRTDSKGEPLAGRCTGHARVTNSTRLRQSWAASGFVAF